MQGCYKVVPGQWPPIRATTSLVTQYEPTTPAGDGGERAPQLAPCPDITMATGSPATTATNSALHSLTTTQLRQEISRMERHLQELPGEVFSSLRVSIEQSLQQAKDELVARRPEGQLLDQAIARHKQQLSQVARVIGAPPPPPPPSPMPTGPALPTQIDSHGSQSAPPPGVLTQLLSTPASPLPAPRAFAAGRAGRSPGRHPLPARSDLVDMADTARTSQQSRSASPPSSLQAVAPAALSSTLPAGSLQPRAADHLSST